MAPCFAQTRQTSDLISRYKVLQSDQRLKQYPFSIFSFDLVHNLWLLPGRADSASRPLPKKHTLYIVIPVFSGEDRPNSPLLPVPSVLNDIKIWQLHIWGYLTWSNQAIRASTPWWKNENRSHHTKVNSILFSSHLCFSTRLILSTLVVLVPKRLLW